MLITPPHGFRAEDSRLRNTAGTPGLRATLPSLSQDFVDYVAVDIGEAHIAATEMEGEFLMVHS
jgi:hypothetical protein